MLCDFCHKNEATIHIQEFHGNERKTLHICQECAEKKASKTLKSAGMDLPEMLMKFTEMEQEFHQDEHKEKSRPPVPAYEVNLVCPACGWNLASFRKTEKLGCPECYKVMGKQIDSVIESVHRGMNHKGMVPAGENTPEKSRKGGRKTKLEIHGEVERLQKELADAVAAERYEDAALLRDKIEHLEKQTGKKAHGV